MNTKLSTAHLGQTPKRNGQSRWKTPVTVEIHDSNDNIVGQKAVTLKKIRLPLLPAVDIDSMTQKDLKRFIPELVKLATGREEVWHSRRSARPAWWPEDVEWATSMKNWLVQKYSRSSLVLVVRSCYRLLEQEDQLKDKQDSTEANTHQPVIPSTKTEEKSSNREGPSSPVKTLTLGGSLYPFCAEIYICYFCEKEFVNKQKMRVHQKECSERPPELQKYQAMTLAVQDRPSDPPPMSPQSTQKPKYPVVSVRQFCRHLDLVPKETAAKLRAKRASLEIDCTLEEIEEPISPVTPVTPRTPRSLISQLSRDDSGALARKRLSYSLSMDKAPDLGNISPESSDSEEEQGDVSRTNTKETNLLAIPISSPLGQRIKNNIHVESPTTVVNNMENFCRTPVKNSFLEKLRKKESSYNIVYKPRKIANLHKQNHLYKFTRKEKKEFMFKTRTGMSLSCFEKMKKMKKPIVLLARLTRRELLRWIPYDLEQALHGKQRLSKSFLNKPSASNSCIFPSGPTLLSPNIDRLLGLKKRSSQSPIGPVKTLSIGNCVSEDIEEELSMQKLTLYKSLLYEMSVLKPAVVLENIDTVDKGRESLPSNIDSEKHSHFSVKSVSRRPSNFKPEQNVSYTIPTKYSTLRALLAPKEQAKPDAKEGESRKDTKDTRFATVTMPSSSTDDKTGLLSTPLYASCVKQVSPRDDSLSIISVSSEGDSINPNCCVGCKGKCLTSPCSYGTDPSPIKEDLASPSLATETNKGDALKSLKVIVDEDAFNAVSVHSQTDMMYGIPSPVSTRSESPLPPSFSRPDTTTNNMEECLSKAEQPGILVYTPRTLRSQANRENLSLCKMQKSDTVESPPVLGRLVSLRSSLRSKSLTPSSSPLKLETPTSGSLPTSPSKSFSKAQGPAKDGSRLSVKRMLLCEKEESCVNAVKKLSAQDRNSRNSNTLSGLKSEPFFDERDDKGRIAAKKTDIYRNRIDLRSRGVKRKAPAQRT